MTYEYDFEMVKRAYAEMARRAREKDEVRRLPRNGLPAQPPPRRSRRRREPRMGAARPNSLSMGLPCLDVRRVIGVDRVARREHRPYFFRQSLPP